MNRLASLRFLLFAALGLACTAIFLLLLQRLAIPVLVFFLPACETFFYDLGAFGAFRAQSFVTFNLTAPRTSVVSWDDSCDHGLVFLDLNGPSVKHRGPLILDSKGKLVWTSDAYGVTINSRIQTFKGKNFLTFWAGEKAATSGKGNYYMLDSSYNVAYTVAAVGDGLRGDLHEFKITDDDTALLTVYTTINADLTSMGMWRSENGWMTDSMFQEVDIETGALLFEWKASDHFGAEDSYMTNPFGGYVESMPFDFFHINSVEKDTLGNYLISARHLHMIACIEGDTGDVLWVHGGRANDFEDLSDGTASDFRWQHDARWLSEEDGIISLFDNGVAWPHMDAPYSQGLVVQLDTDNRTASLLHSYVSLQHVRSSSQGSLQFLPTLDGETHVFIGWGSSAAYTEFAADGELLCETHFGASWLYFWERVKSYRAFKAPTQAWQARPTGWMPSASISGGKLYVTWNGATEVTHWALQGARDDEAGAAVDFDELEIIDKAGFESSFVLSSDRSCSQYRVAALDAEGEVLGYSGLVAAEPAWSLMAYFLAAASALVGVALVLSLWVLRRRGHSWQSLARSIPTIDRSKYQKLW